VLGAADELHSRTADFRDRLLATPPADPADPVRLPGQSEIANLRRQEAAGVEIQAADLDALRELRRHPLAAGGRQ
jgi:LDH2 family malate/lactate/ureidoglycolate dehydrogenase